MKTIFKHFLSAITLSTVFFTAVANDNNRPRSFIIIGDVHYDRIENHDMSWLEQKPSDYRQVTKTYTVNTENYWNAYSKTLRHMSQQPGMIAITQLGDLSEGLAGNIDKARQMNDHLFKAIDDIGFEIPMIITKGNHDVTGPGAKEIYPDTYLPNMTRLAQLDEPLTAANYTKQIDDVLFVAYDVYERKCTPQWLDNVLKTSDAKYKFVLVHDPVIPINYRCWHTYRKPNQAKLRQELLHAIASNGAIVLAAHLHQYAIVRRDTEWGPIVQINVNSVINNDNKNKLRKVATVYDPQMVDEKPNWQPSSIEERREMLAAEAPHVKFYKQADMPGYAVMNITSEGRLVLDYYPNVQTKPCDTVDITAIYDIK